MRCQQNGTKRDVFILSCEPNGARCIGLDNGVVHNALARPFGRQGRVGGETELGDKSRHDTKECGIVVKRRFGGIVRALRQQLVDVVDADRSPRANELGVVTDVVMMT